jgi:hypothetical protein
MMQDRDQKHKALKLCVANRWFPQLEVDVQPVRAIRVKAPLVTDLDVFASMPNVFRGFQTLVFDCKTKAKESPVNRSLWLRGVLDRLNADQGFCILRKEAIQLDHRMLATRLGIILLAEDEFDLYAAATSMAYKGIASNTSDIDLWDKFFAIPSAYPKLQEGLVFIRSAYWMIDDPAEACRKTLATLRALNSELDPAKPEHLAIFLDFAALFARSLAVVVSNIFKAYLHPANQVELSEALLTMLYGGHEAYEHRNQLYKRVKYQNKGTTPMDLSLPEWERFLILTRQLLDAPAESQRVPLILREVGFGILNRGSSFPFASSLCTESPQAARFALMVPDYLARAAKLPPEFGQASETVLLPLQPVK